VFLDKATKILDEKKFIDSHVAIIRANKKKKVSEPYLNRLKNYFDKIGDPENVLLKSIEC
jgi:hypothetical protein